MRGMSVDEGGLAGAGWAYEGEGGAGGDSEVDVAQDGSAGEVGEVQVAELEGAVDGVCGGEGFEAGG